MPEHHTLLSPLDGRTLDQLVGERVTIRTEGTRSPDPDERGVQTYTSTSSGVYLGVVRSDHDGAPMHLFVDGEVNGIPQSAHGYPAPLIDPASTLSSSTAIVEEWQRTHPAAREVLVHLNVEVPADDPRTADQVAEHLMAALEVGLEGAEDAGVGLGLVVMALAEDA